MGIIKDVKDDVKDFIDLIKDAREFVNELMADEENNPDLLKENVLGDRLFLISSETFGNSYISDGNIAFPICRSIGRTIVRVDSRLVNFVNNNLPYYLNIDAVANDFANKKVKVSEKSISSFLNFGKYHADILRNILMAYAEVRNLKPIKDLNFTRKGFDEGMKEALQLLLQPGLTLLVGQKASGKNLFIKALGNSVELGRIDIGEPEPNSIPMLEGLGIISYFYPHDVRVKVINSAKGLQTISQKNLGSGGVSQTFIDDLETISSYSEKEGRNVFLTFNPKSTDPKVLADLYSLTLPAAIQVVARLSNLIQRQTADKIVSTVDLTIESRNLKREPIFYEVVIETKLDTNGFRDDKTTQFISFKSKNKGTKSKGFSNILRGGI